MRGVSGVIELVVLACLLAEPQHCEEFHVPFLPTTLAPPCVTKQPTYEIVQWAITHPGWTIRKWTCGPPRA
jgi:hypothetical protein